MKSKSVGLQKCPTFTLLNSTKTQLNRRRTHLFAALESLPSGRDHRIKKFTSEGPQKYRKQEIPCLLMIYSYFVDNFTLQMLQIDHKVLYNKKKEIGSKIQNTIQSTRESLVWPNEKNGHLISAHVINYNC